MKTSRKTAVAAAIRLSLIGALAVLPAAASSIFYSVGAIATGSLNGTPFTNELVTFTQVVTNISSIADCPSQSYPCAPSVTGNTVTIATVGTETLTGATFFFDNGLNVFGITNSIGGAYLAAEDNSFATYNMLSDFGPTGYALCSCSLPFSGLATSGGSLTLSAIGGSVTAQAGTPASSGVPEPGPLGLMLLGGIPLTAGLWRRKTKGVTPA